MSDIVLLPRDGLFLKDGREWATSQAGRAHSLGWPMPSTLHGALVTFCGRQQEAAGRPLAAADWLDLAQATSLGPNVALRRSLGADGAGWRQAHRVWPVPSDALFRSDAAGEAERIRRLDPEPPELRTLSRDDDPAREALWRPRVLDQAKPARSPQWWAEEAFVAWLAEDAAERPCRDAYRGLALPRHVQSHVGIDPETLTAREEILFAHDVVEMTDRRQGGFSEWAIACRTSMPTAERGVATLGGDRRPAVTAPAPADLLGFPPGLAAAFDAKRPKGLRLVAVTPLVFAGGWLPDGLGLSGNVYRGRLPGIGVELILRAALVPRATYVSGWDMAKAQPKPTTRLVPPGAVYHFVRTDGEGFTAADVEPLWLGPIGGRAEEGFGYCVPGVWQPAENGS